MSKILIIDDEKGVRESFRFALKDKYKLILCSNGNEGLEMVEKENPDLIILDIILPDMNGLEVLKKIKQINKDLPVIMLTAVSQVKTAVESMKEGAIDYITKPFDLEELILIIEKVLQREKLISHIELLRNEIKSEYPIDRPVFKSKIMENIIILAERCALSDSPVLITGPTGVGKELIARYIHEKSLRKNNPFVPIHCAAIPETLFESELFGYEKGAFTNAFKSKKGKIELANEGTLFFDEIGEIPLNIQIKLLRFIEEKKFSPLGSNEVIESNIRIICATSKNLEEEIKRGTFREDLFYRLNVIPIKIPPLKERKEDIIPLLEYYFDFYKKKFHSKINKFSDQVKKVFIEYEWPGNVRELKNIIERIFVLCSEKEVIEIEDLPYELREKVMEKIDTNADERINIETTEGLYKEVEKLERRLIMEALKKVNWNQTKAAELLKISRRMLRYKIEKYGIMKQ